MIRTYSDVAYETNERLRAKTLDSLFKNQLQSEMNISPFVANGILGSVYDCYKLDEDIEKNKMLPGKMKIMVVDSREPAGKKLSECRMKAVVITMMCDEDKAIRKDWDAWQRETEGKYGKNVSMSTALRRFRLLRVADEAHEQGGNLSQEDLAYNIFGCGLKTVRRDIKALKENGLIVPTRGQQKDIGRGTSHKGQAVKWFLAGIETKEIARRMYHSLGAVERYIKAFTRVAFLVEQGHKLPEMSFLTGLSYSLCAEYKRVYETAETEGKVELIKDLIEGQGSALAFVKKKGDGR